MSLLINCRRAEFSYLLENINTTKGNLSFQLSKLGDAGYIKIKKSFRGNYPLTTCEITNKGIDAYKTYVDAIDDYFNNYKKTKNE
jgi:DNA-binding transcriptional ArsR family regulator